MNFNLRVNKIFSSLVLFTLVISLAGFSCKQEQQPTNEFEPDQGIEQQTQEDFEVTMVVGESEYKTTIAAGITVWQLMNKLKEESDLTFLAKDYPGMGHLIETINEVTNDTTQNKYWIYYINNEMASVGISDYVLQPNDIITWKYEESSF